MERTILMADGSTILVDAADYEELSQYSWHKHSGGYAAAWMGYGRKNRKKITMHRYLMEPTGTDVVDHINMNILDNRRSNLRICTRSQNCANSLMRASNTSGYKGVSWNSSTRKWHAIIQRQGVVYNLGSSHDPQIASELYREAALRLFGEFARIA